MHEQHRDRVRNRFLKEDIDHFDPHQVLELMLFYSVPRKDTNEIAHRLIDRFGGFAQVLDAPVEELLKVEGIGPQSAVLLKMIRSSYRYYQMQITSSDVEFNRIDQCGAYLSARMNGRKNEEVHLLCLDGKKKLINCVKIDEGTSHAVVLSGEKVLKVAISNNATCVILGHNHPGAFAVPSGEDVDSTKRLAKILLNAGIYLLDHYVVNDVEYTSMFESRLYNPEDFGICIGR